MTTRSLFFTLASLFLLAPALGGCSGSDTESKGPPERVSFDAAAVCDRAINECGNTGQTMQECIDSLSPLKVSQACVDAMDAASCTEINANNSTTEETCFPSCSTAGQTCNGDDTISICRLTSGKNRSFVANCDDVCKAQSKTYAGSCGKSFSGNTSDKDVCWCK